MFSKLLGVSGISILGDTKYFGGSLEDLIQARNSVDLPILRKEFIVILAQLWERLDLLL